MRTIRLAVLDALNLALKHSSTYNANLVTVSRVDGTLRLEACDGDACVRTRVADDGDEFLPTHVDGKTLKRALSSLKDDTVALELDDNGDVEVRFDGLTVPVVHLEHTPTCQGHTLGGEPQRLTDDDLALIGRVASMASRDRSRAVLETVRFDGRQVAATDSYRLAWGTVRPELDALVRTGPLGIVCGLQDVHVGQDGEDVWFEGVQVKGPKKALREVAVQVITEQVQGRFPNWRGLVPAHFATEATIIDIGRSIELVEALGKTADEKTPLHLNVGDHGIDATRAKVSAVLDATVVGDGGTTAFNPTYLAQALTAAGSNVRLRMNDGLKPAVIDGVGCNVLLMPMRVA